MHKSWLPGVAFFVTAFGAFAQIPTVPPDAVVNAASFAVKTPVSPGSLVSIFGTDLATTLAHADSIPLATTLAGVSVTFNGAPAPMLDAVPAAAGGSLTQINAQIPWNVLPQGMTAGSVNVVVTVNGVDSKPTPVQIDAFQPGLFTLNSQGTGQAAVQIGNTTTFAAPVGSIPGAQSQPAKAGDVLVVYAVGLGAVDHPPASGDIPRGALANTLEHPKILIGKVPAPAVFFSGLSPQFVGLYQINVQVPEGVPAGGAVPLQFDLGGGLFTSDKVTIAVE